MALLIAIAEQTRWQGALPWSPQGRRRGTKFCAMVVWSWLLGLGLFGPGRSGAETTSYEYPLKAVFLLNFAHFTVWPTNALTDAQAPFVIGVLGGDPFGDALNVAVRDENWNGHPIVIQRYRQMEEVQACQILFIASSEMRRLPKIMAELKDRPILTVADVEGSMAYGVIVQFLTENNKIRFKINPGALKEAKLMMSSKLLRVAEIVAAQNK